MARRGKTGKGEGEGMSGGAGLNSFKKRCVNFIIICVKGAKSVSWGVIFVIESCWGCQNCKNPLIKDMNI